ncbi:MAG: hypothetical protein OEL53_02305 [Rhodospirillales bacterium]|jgi:hypothetical protein|nr:hypothetical protein [Rhodospirillales bacterium]
MAYVVHHVPGRLRLRLPAERRNAQTAARYGDYLGDVDGVVSIDANNKAGSLIVQYDPKRTNGQELLARLEGAGLLTGRQAAPASAAASHAVNLLGAAIGNALFGAVLRTGVEKSILSLMGRR